MRFADIFLSVILLITMIPLIVLIVILLFISQKKIFFSSIRVGKNGKKFKLIKFCTIKKSHKNPKNEKFYFFGKFLRRSSLDELPQIINVIKGEMSLVGPRPLPQNIEKKIFINFKKKRRSVLPGITGYSQLKYKGKKRSINTKVKEDLFFIENKNLFNYFKIICLTPVYIIIKYIKNKSGYSL